MSAFNDWRRQSIVMVVVASALASATSFGGVPLQPDHVPRYDVDTSWPKPFPDRWVLGRLGGVCVDARDHVFANCARDFHFRQLLG